MLSVVIFLASGLYFVYILLLYPIWLAARARRHTWPVRKNLEAPLPRISVLLAVHNGERFLEAKLQSLLQLDYPPELLEIIVASDGSTDRTGEIAASFADRRVRLINVERGGKPRALNAAMAAASGEVLLFTDVRQPLDPGGLRELVANLADPQVGAVSGELVIVKGDSREEADVSRYWRYEFAIRMRQSAIDSIFGATGAYYALRRSLAVPIPETMLLDDVYLPLHAFFQGYRLVVEPKARAYDTPTKLDAEFRRKVRTLAGNYQILGAYPHLLCRRNRMLFHFLSHKFGRLWLPFALLAMAASSPFLPQPWAALALSSQAAFYLLAFLDPQLPDRSLLKKLSSPVRTLVTLMAATLCALSILVVPAAKLWAAPSQTPAPGQDAS